MIRALIVLVAAVALALYVLWKPPEPRGFTTSATLAELMERPDSYAGRTVRVSGRVADRASLLGLGGVLLTDDEDHEILVLGLTSPPRPGTETSVTGRFRLLFTAGTLQTPVILVEAQG